jgi:dihydroorotate dehydrogenase (fumarate)
MNLSTRYLGLPLAHPLVVGASPMVDDLDTVRRLEAAGAAAIVMHSLFEEQIEAESHASHRTVEQHHDAYAEALSFFPDPSEYSLGPKLYLDQLRRIKAAVKVPVIASLNGTTAAGWVRYAQQLEDAGADALELNVYLLATRTDVDGKDVEERVVELASRVRQTVRIPLAVKLSPFYSSLPNLARRLHDAGVNGLVLFNRFLQPDIDIEELEVKPKITLSTSAELLLRLRWLAILHGRVGLELACTGGVHTPEDAIKAIMTGAQVVQVVSALLKHGPERMTDLVRGVETWMREREYVSVDQMRGSMSLLRSPDPEHFERANYHRVLQTWKG